MKTLVLGMGNPILRDDSIGLRVVDRLKGLFFDPDVKMVTTALSGLSLLEFLEGFDRAIIVDAIQTGERPGEIYHLMPTDFVKSHSSPHLHNIDFFQTLTLCRELQDMPGEVIVVAIEVEDVTTFGEDLTPEVEKAIPLAASHVLSILQSETLSIKED